MPTIYELVKLDEDAWDCNGGYPVETHLGYYSSEGKAEEAWLRYKKIYSDEISDVQNPDSNRVGYDIYEMVADDQDNF